MCIEIIRNKDNLFCLWIQVSEIYCNIQSGLYLYYNGFPFACQKVRKLPLHYGHIRNSPFLSRLTGNTVFLFQLFVRFVYTHNKTKRVIRALIDFQHVFHFCHKFSVRFRDSPFLYKPRFDFVFFMTSQIMLSVM